MLSYLSFSVPNSIPCLYFMVISYTDHSMCPISLSFICSSFAGPKVTWASFHGGTWLQHPKIWKIIKLWISSPAMTATQEESLLPCISPLDLCFRFVLWLECPLAILRAAFLTQGVTLAPVPKTSHKDCLSNLFWHHTSLHYSQRFSFFSLEHSLYLVTWIRGLSSLDGHPPGVFIFPFVIVRNI